jgi:hypothetical protein
MMTADDASRWMLTKLESEGCVYQDDVVDFLVKNKVENLLRENADGNLVLGREVLNSFKKLTEINVVWVKPDRYWRFRVQEDEPDREARG